MLRTPSSTLWPATEDAEGEVSRTRVVNIKRGEEYDVYIGRAGHGLDGYYGNPYRLQEGESRGATIQRYKAYFLERIEKDTEFRRRVLELKGKRLGCFCVPFNRCHGEVIVEWLEGPEPAAPEQMTFF